MSTSTRPRAYAGGKKNLKKNHFDGVIDDQRFFDFFFQNFFSDFFSDPTSALIEIDRISQALENQAPFPCREDAKKKNQKKKWILRYFWAFP